MIVRIDKSFQKDTSKINDAKIKLAIAETIEDIQRAENIFAIKVFQTLVEIVISNIS